VLTALATLVVAVLFHGASQRSQPRPTTTPAPPPGSPSPMLRADLEKAPLSYQSDFWLQLGSRVRNKLCLVGPRGSSALVLASDLAVSTIDAAGASGAQLAEAPASGPGSTSLFAADPRAGVALFQISPVAAEDVFQAAAPESVHPGMLVAAVSLDPEGRLEVMPGHVLSAPGPSSPSNPTPAAQALEVFVPLATSTTIAAIVDLDGNLVGAVLRGVEGTTVRSADSLLTTLTQLREHPQCRSLEVADPDQSVRSLLGVKGGVVVERVAPGAFRPEVSLQAGDLLLEWNGKKVAGTPQFLKLYDATPPGAVASYLGRRGERVVRGRLAMPGSDCRPPDEPPVRLARTGLTLAWDPAGPGSEAPPSAWRVTRVAPGSPAQGSGIQPGDRILSDGGHEPDREKALAKLAAFERQGRPILLAVERKDHVRLLALQGEGR